MAQIIEDRLATLREPGADDSPQQILITKINGDSSPQTQTNHRTPHLRHRTKRSRRDIKERLSFTISLDQDGEKSALARRRRRTDSFDHLALQHQDHLRQTRALFDETLQDGC